MREMGMYVIGTEVSPYFLEGQDTNNSISGFILSNNLLYNLCFSI